MKNRLVILLLFYGVLLSAQHKQLPNIVVVLTDDQGWNALSVRMDPDIPGSGSTYYQTPNLEKLVAQGVRFSRAYSPAPTCCPSRHSIQFGRSPSSLGLFGGCSEKTLKADVKYALCNVIKKSHPEYATAHFGKWHMCKLPEDMGFDEHDGKTGNSEGNSKDKTDPKKTFSLSKAAAEFMDRQVNNDRPFFVQVSYYANHTRYQALKSTEDKYINERAGYATPYQKSPLWAAMNEDLDSGVGIILDKIKSLNIEENTYVIFTSDNGYEDKHDQWKPVSERSFYKAYPLLSHKYFINEGGIRVPFIISGPDISQNVHSSTPVVGYDIYPTIMSILGIRTNDIPDIEGGNLLPLLTTNLNQKVERQHPFLIFRYTKPSGSLDIAIVQDDYKLLKEIESNTLHLWNVTEDLGEQHNLLETMPEKVSQLSKSIDAYYKHVGWEESEAVVVKNKVESKQSKK